jgi:transcriptional regulator with XRE-family HTH domain
MNIGNNLRNFRLNNKLSRKKLSEITGVSSGYIEEIENGKKKPTIEILLKISSSFNITVSELIGETEPSLSPELKNLLDSAKELNPEQIQKLTEFIQIVILNKNDC